MRNSKILRKGLAIATSVAMGLSILNAAPALAAEPELPAPDRVDTVPTPTQPEIDNIEHLYPGARKKYDLYTRDKVRVKVWEYGKSPKKAETIVMTGGYPWASNGLDMFARILATQYHVVRYDHRASGESSHPKGAHMYKLERLANEMYDVIRHTAGNKPVHVFGEAWGAFIASQVSHQYRGSIRSLTSLGAPSIDLAGNLYARDKASGDVAAQLEAAKQMSGLWYIWLMRGTNKNHPSATQQFLKKTLLESGLVADIMNAPMSFMSGDFNTQTNWMDMRYGIYLYREAFIDHWEHPAYDYLHIPVVHFLNMKNDFIETDYLVKGLEERTPHYIRHDLTSDHLTWVTYVNTLLEYINQSINTWKRLY